MLNEWKEFQDYTGAVNYTARNKQDTTYLVRFTFDTILDFEGLNRVLTILARGFLLHNEDGSPAEAPRERIDYAKRGLCAWCSVPSSKNTSTSEAGGCHCAGIALCSSRTRATRNTVCQLREDCYLPPVNGPLDGILSCSPISSSFSWFLTYSAIRLSFFPTVST